MAEQPLIEFTKLIVSDLEKMARFYSEVFDLEELHRLQADWQGETVDEIFLGRDGAFTGLCLFSFVGRPPAQGELILGIGTDDIATTFKRAEALGATCHGPHSGPETGGRLMGFMTDPEGHMSEVVQGALP